MLDRMPVRDREFLRCPVCRDAALDLVQFAGLARHACAGCGGAWVDDEALVWLFEQLGQAAHEPIGPWVSEPSQRVCVRCTGAMARERAPGTGPAIEIDVCAVHGAWFDGGELPATIERLSLEVTNRTFPLAYERAEASSFADLVRWLVQRKWRRPTRRRGEPET
jgi:Zn-finger nucleic acid-binding protein